MRRKEDDTMRKVAIVGFGFMGKTHLGAWKKCPGARVVAVCDSNLAQLTAKVVGNIRGVADNAALPKSVKVWSDYDAMLAAGGLDIVDLTLPTPLHPAMTERALAAGCHVLCEKPMALTLAACDRMIAAARKARRQLLVAHCLRFFPEYAALREIVTGGRYGRVIAADFTRFITAPKWSPKGGGWLLDETKSGGPYVDTHIHDVDYLLSLFGLPVKVRSQAHRSPDGCVDHLSTSYDYGDGRVVTADCSFAAAKALTFDAAARVFLEKATVYLGGAYRNPLTVYPEEGRPIVPKLAGRTGYEEEVRHFLALVEGRRPKGLLTVEDARNALAVALAERKSAETGRPVAPAVRRKTGATGAARARARRSALRTLALLAGALAAPALLAYDPLTADAAKASGAAVRGAQDAACRVAVGTGLDPLSRPSFSLNGTWSYILDPQDFGAAEFYKDLKQDGVALVQHDFDRAPKMRVPTDWNSVDRALLYYEGPMWLRRKFAYSAKPGQRAILRFGAVNDRADVWLNGRLLGSHTGGFTPFAFDVTAFLTNDCNSLVVRADATRRAEGIPCKSFDWWNYGGITRDVVIFDVPEVSVSEGVLQCARGCPTVLEGLVRASVARAGLTARVEIPELGLRAEAQTDGAGCARFRLDARPELWSPARPRLYDVTFACGEDAFTDKIGFRTVEARGKRILLNGEPVLFKGVCLHDEKLGGGRVARVEDILPQLELAQELGCNFLRLAHYPHNEATVREAERRGIMVWSEIPVYWNVQWTNEATLAAADRQLCEMVRRDVNRAAVVVWSIANETPYGAARDRFLTALAKRARALDPTRLLSMAMEIGDVKGRVCTVTDTLHPLVDIVSFNQYIGWYWASAQEADDFVFRIPYDKPVVISEFGGGALHGRRGPKTERWTEEFQAELYRANLAMLSKIDGLSGLMPWVLNDFRSPRRPCPGLQDGFNRKGLVSEKGEKKLAFEVVRQRYAEWEVPR